MQSSTLTSFTHESRKRTASRKQRAFILNKQKNTCFLCKQFNPNLEVDHIIPYAVGGVTELKNLRALCPNCHAQKSRNSNESFKIRNSKFLKEHRRELCWTCEKIVSPYFFMTGECYDCLFDGPKVKKKTWQIPFSPIESDYDSS